jgi:O-antigen/teichoic acid export membrane protein
MDSGFSDRRRLRALFYYSSSAVVCQSIRLVGILVTTWRIGKADFATYATALMLVGFCNMLRDLGQDPALISLPVLRRGFIRCHFIMSIGLGFLAAVVLTLLIWFTPWFLDLKPIYPFLPALIMIEAGYHTAQIACLRRFRFAAIAGIEIFAIMSWLSVAVIMSVRLSSVYCLLAATLTELICRGLGLCFVARSDLGPARIRRSVVGYFFRYVKLLTAQSWIQHWAEHIDVLLLRVFGNQSELGAYAQMQQVAGVAFYLSVRSLDQVANASYSLEQRKPAKLQRLVLFFGSLTMVACLAAIIFIYAFIHFFSERIFGLSWKREILDLWWWALPLCIMRPLMWNFLISFESTSRPSLLLSSIVVNTCLSILLGVVMVIPFGARGLYIALGISQLMTVLLQISWSRELNVCSGREIPPFADKTAV